MTLRVYRTPAPDRQLVILIAVLVPGTALRQFLEGRTNNLKVSSAIGFPRTPTEVIGYDLPLPVLWCMRHL